MKRLFLIPAMVLALSVPVSAEQKEDEGLSLMEKGAELLLEGILREMEPAIDDLKDMAGEIEPAMRQFFTVMGPALAELLSEIDDLSNYHLPEMLPNGDIIIRRKTPLVPEEEPEGEIEI